MPNSRFWINAKRFFKTLTTVYLIAAALFMAIGLLYGILATDPPPQIVRIILIGYLAIMLSFFPVFVFHWIGKCQESNRARNITYTALLVLAYMLVKWYAKG